MYSEDHEPPHIHVLHASETIKIDFKGKILIGYLQPNLLKILKKWIIQHKEELEMNWNLVREGKKIIKIQPWSKNE
jgi:hypothetical protein